MNKKEIQFIGKITAGVTHEINNALASIKEISGLLTDLISMSSDESFPHKEKFGSVLPKIQEQVKRGVTLTTRLNKFSHLTDETKAEVELNEFLELLIFLIERFARLKNVELLFTPTDNSIEITTIPILLQMAVYNCVVYILNNSSPGGKIIIQPATDKDLYSIVIKYEGETSNRNILFTDSSSAEGLEILDEVISELNGKTEMDTSSKSIALRFYFNK